MASSPDSPLTPLQRDVLRAFFGREHDFYLTGGAALAGYHLGHVAELMELAARGSCRTSVAQALVRAGVRGG